VSSSCGPAGVWVPPRIALACMLWSVLVVCNAVLRKHWCWPACMVPCAHVMQLPCVTCGVVCWVVLMGGERFVVYSSTAGELHLCLSACVCCHTWLAEQQLHWATFLWLTRIWVGALLSTCFVLGLLSEKVCWLAVRALPASTAFCLGCRFQALRSVVSVGSSCHRPPSKDHMHVLVCILPARHCNQSATHVSVLGEAMFSGLPACWGPTPQEHTQHEQPIS